MDRESFEWDPYKDFQNRQKHGISFQQAQYAFLDPNRIIVIDRSHSRNENRYFCIGKVEDIILTVRFTYRAKVIRIIGAGAWRRGKRLYEEKNQIH